MKKEKKLVALTAFLPVLADFIEDLNDQIELTRVKNELEQQIKFNKIENEL